MSSCASRGGGEPKKSPGEKKKGRKEENADLSNFSAIIFSHMHSPFLRDAMQAMGHQVTFSLFIRVWGNGGVKC